MSDPAAEEFEINLGGARAVIGNVGASLLDYQVDGHQYAHSRHVQYPSCPVPSAGKVMVPWPNRVAGGKWMYRDEPQQLKITEPDRGNAIHGLVGDQHWKLVDRSRSEVSLEISIDAQPGWPVPLHTTVSYQVGGWGLRVTHGVRNIGDRPVPFGVGAHPYLLPGPANLGDCDLKLTASKVLPYDPETMLPTGAIRHVGSTEHHNFRRGKMVCEALTNIDLDNTFGRCRAGKDGVVRHSLTWGRRGVELWTDPAFRWVHAYMWLPDDPPGLGVAIEPMTCPPNALNSGVDLITLQPGKSWHASWGIRPLIN
ncbi:MAG: aldose epimerase [Pseudonocardiaceae bacterium]|nr:aldose epimerase [Pseudonocardiaceae bacterium]